MTKKTILISTIFAVAIMFGLTSIVGAADTGTTSSPDDEINSIAIWCWYRCTPDPNGSMWCNDRCLTTSGVVGN